MDGDDPLIEASEEAGDTLSESAGDSHSTPGKDEPTSPRRSSVEVGAGFLILVVGLILGSIGATFGADLLFDNAVAIFSTLLSVVLIFGVFIGIILVFRRRIWQSLFSRGEIEVSKFAQPLADVARHAANQRVDDATESAKNLAEMVLARYSWIATRRWMVATLTALIASIATLAGAALLFQQNILLKEQTERLTEQNLLITDQSGLITTEIQLAEAERNSQIGEYVVDIGSRISDDRQVWLEAGKLESEFGIVGLSAATRGRIVAATLVARPYRYLQPNTPDDRNLEALADLAMSRRADALKPGSTMQPNEPTDSESVQLSPVASPERGDILNLLIGNSIRDTALLSFAGANFSYAEFRRDVMPGFSLDHARVSFANFDRVRLIECTFRGASMSHSRFENGVVRQCDFSSIPGADVQEPFSGEGLDYLRTNLAGASFKNTVVFQSRFDNVNGLAVNFDDAVIAECSFTGSSIPATTFRNTILIDCDFNAAALQSIALDGAIVFEPAFIERIAKEAAPGTFVPDRWTLEEITEEELHSHPGFIEMINHLPEKSFIGKTAYRVSRVETSP